MTAAGRCCNWYGSVHGTVSSCNTACLWAECKGVGWGFVLCCPPTALCGCCSPRPYQLNQLSKYYMLHPMRTMRHMSQCSGFSVDYSSTLKRTLMSTPIQTLDWLSRSAISSQFISENVLVMTKYDRYNESSQFVLQSQCSVLCLNECIRVCLLWACTLHMLATGR